MPLKKILLKAGINRENTRYTTEGGWYDCDKVRFRQGTPEKIGGWKQISENTFLGVCRSIWNWITLIGFNIISLGTSLKFYLNIGGVYTDITPLRDTTAPGDVTFAASNGSTVLTVTDVDHGVILGDFVTFAYAQGLGGVITDTILNAEFQVQAIIDDDNYEVTLPIAADVSDIGNGGSDVIGMYQINTGPEFTVPIVGWSASFWGSGASGVGTSVSDALRVWSQSNFGEDLIFGPRGGGIYYWDATVGHTNPTFTVTIASPAVVTTVETSLVDDTAVILNTTGELPTGLLPGIVYYVVNSLGTTFELAAAPGGTPINTSGTQSGTHNLSSRGINLADLAGASNVPTKQNYILVSDISRFVFCFGCNDIGTTTVDPMLVRWSNQEDAVEWTPAATNQAGSLRLSRGSEIVTALQARQEILVWTDSAMYSFQYVGAPGVWGAQIVGETISIVSQNAVAYASGVSYWMGIDKFYMYDGRVQTLRCDLRQYIFNDINKDQFPQVFAGTNDGFNEVWWFYCSSGSLVIDKYVVYNYREDIWYYGTMGRTAWLESGLQFYPLAATYINNLVFHETGNDNEETVLPAPINAYITSAEFDLEDGHQFSFIYRILPDITFRGSTTNNPSATMYVLPLANSGSGYNVPPSVGGVNNVQIDRTAVLPIEAFTGQIFTRIRGRQIAMKVESTGLGVAWQLGSPRIDMRPDGRR
jgi:hypothetical protein